MARPKDTKVRTRLIECAAQMLATREPITLRSLVASADVSTMAVYTHFGSMDGVWSSVRQEAFERLNDRVGQAPPDDDPIAELGAQYGAYASFALEQPDLYRVVFDASCELLDDELAGQGMFRSRRTIGRAQEMGRIRSDLAVRDISTQCWSAVHGIMSLIVSGQLSPQNLQNIKPMLHALLVAAGDDPSRCRDSLAAGWSSV